MTKETDRRIAAAAEKLMDKGWYQDVLKAAGTKNAADIEAARKRGSEGRAS
jgi:hypothetical protein